MEEEYYGRRIVVNEFPAKLPLSTPQHRQLGGSEANVVDVIYISDVLWSNRFVSAAVAFRYKLIDI